MDRQFMKLALEQAVKAAGRTSPNPMVGAVVVKKGQVVSTGYHACAGGPHAEVVALQRAADASRGATLYVTLEPCCHYGKTGPCTEAIIKAGIFRVVVAATDPNSLVSGKGIKQLKEAGIEVETGVMEREAKRLNEAFNKYIVHKVPFVIAKAAMSLDGKIATFAGESKWITGEDARKNAHKLRDKCDAILVGIGTVLSDDPSLTARLEDGGGQDPVRVVLDSNARTPPDCKMLTQESPAPTYIVVSKKADKDRVSRLTGAGAEVITLENNPHGIDLDALLGRLGEKEITSLLVEGGATVHGRFFIEGLVDKVTWYISPLVIGGRDAPGPVGDRGAEKLKDALRLDRLEAVRCGEDLILQGYPVK